MSNIKPITINPDLFKVGGSLKKDRSNHNKTQKISTIKNNIQPNKLKRELLQKIKNYKHNDSLSKNKEERNLEKQGVYNNLDISNKDSFENEFTKSLNFLQQLSQKRNNKTLKANRPLINIDVPDNLKEKDYYNSNNNISDKNNTDVPYGCLKNGNKPTYRQWKNTTMKNTSYTEPQLVNIPEKNNFTSSYNNDTNIQNEIKKEVNEAINNTNNTDNINTDNSIHIDNSDKTNINTNYISTKTKSIKYHLGKRNRKVSVLIKNAATRKKVNAEHNKIKRTSILEMKNYLRKHNLLKAGSEAPNDIIRKLYEQCLLSGNIHNTNKDNLLHNYLNDEK